MAERQLSKSHHKAVAALTPEQQTFFLGEARLQGWTAKQLKEAIDRVMAPQRPVIRLDGRRLRLA